MAKNNIFRLRIFFLSLVISFLSGCVYIEHWDDVMFLKGMQDNQKEMQVTLDKEKKLYDKLRADIDSGRLRKSMSKNKVFNIYGKPALCKSPEGKSDIKETCFYRNPAGKGLFSEMILLNFDSNDKLLSWEVQDPGKEEAK